MFANLASDQIILVVAQFLSALLPASIALPLQAVLLVKPVPIFLDHLALPALPHAQHALPPLRTA